MPEKFENLLKRHGLEESKFTGALAAEAMRVFKERTDGMLEIAWRKHGWQLENLVKVVERFGFDCYHQGVMDGARVDDLLRFLGAPGDWGYDTELGDLTLNLLRIRGLINRT